MKDSTNSHLPTISLSLNDEIIFSPMPYLSLVGTDSNIDRDYRTSWPHVGCNIVYKLLRKRHHFFQEILLADKCSFQFSCRDCSRGSVRVEEGMDL